MQVFWRKLSRSAVVAAVLGLLFAMQPFAAAQAQVTSGSATTCNISADGSAPGGFDSTCAAKGLDKIAADFQQQTWGWVPTLKAEGEILFGALALLAMCWMGYDLLFAHGHDFNHFLHELAKFIVVTGVAFLFLDKGDVLATEVITGLSMLATNAVNSAAHTTLLTGYGAQGLIVAAGYVWGIISDIASQYTFGFSGSDPLGLLIMLLITGISATVILVAMALEVLVAWIVSFGLIYGGIFFMGFGGASWSREYGMGYLKTVLSIGAYLMGMLLAAGLFLQETNGLLQTLRTDAIQAMANGNGGDFFKASIQYKQAVSSAFDMYLLEAALCYLVIKKLPGMMASIPIGGTRGSEAGSGVGAAAMGVMTKAIAAAVSAGVGAVAAAAAGATAAGAGAAGGGEMAGAAGGGGGGGGGTPLMADPPAGGGGGGTGGGSGTGGGATSGGGAASGGETGFGGGAAAGRGEQAGGEGGGAGGGTSPASGGSATGAQALAKAVEDGLRAANAPSAAAKRQARIAKARATGQAVGRVLGAGLMAPIVAGDRLDGSSRGNNETAIRQALMERAKAGGGGSDDSDGDGASQAPRQRDGDTQSRAPDQSRESAMSDGDGDDDGGGSD